MAQCLAASARQYNLSCVKETDTLLLVLIHKLCIYVQTVEIVSAVFFFNKWYDSVSFKGMHPLNVSHSTNVCSFTLNTWRSHLDHVEYRLFRQCYIHNMTEITIIMSWQLVGFTQSCLRPCILDSFVSMVMVVTLNKWSLGGWLTNCFVLVLLTAKCGLFILLSLGKMTGISNRNMC